MDRSDDLRKDDVKMCNIVPTFIYDNYISTNFQKETLADVWRSCVKNSFNVPFFVLGY